MSDDNKKKLASDVRPLPQRFYEKVSYDKLGDGLQILLDGRPIKTPQKNIVLAPTEKIAKAIVNEWDSQSNVVDPALMPCTKMLNTAIDRVPEHKVSIIDELVSYAGTDMICYRAGDPESLVSLQAEKWDPLLRWVGAAHNIELKKAEGIIHCAQEPEELEKVRNYLTSQSDLFLACFHSLTSLSGSVVVAMACAEEELSVKEAWECAHLDANWQAERWGIDEEAENARKNAFKEFEAAAFMVKSH